MSLFEGFTIKKGVVFKNRSISLSGKALRIESLQCENIVISCDETLEDKIIIEILSSKPSMVKQVSGIDGDIASIWFNETIKKSFLDKLIDSIFSVFIKIKGFQETDWPLSLLEIRVPKNSSVHMDGVYADYVSYGENIGHIQLSGGAFSKVNAGSCLSVYFDSYFYNDISLQDIKSRVECIVDGPATGTVNGETKEIELTLAGTGDFRVEKCDSLTAFVEADSNLTIRSVKDHMKLRMEGYGDVDINDTANVSVTMKGAGNLTVGKIRENAIIDLDGDGTVDISNFSGKSLRVMSRGDGDIVVQHGDVSSLSARISGEGGLRYGGSLQELELRMESDATVLIQSQPDHVSLTSSRNEHGKVKIGGKYFYAEDDGLDKSAFKPIIPD